MASKFYSLYSHDFIRIASCVPRTRVADVAANLSETVRLAQQGDALKTALDFSRAWLIGLCLLQSFPILGYLSFTVVFFVYLFPGSVLGPELAAIFAIFTSQAWNMAFSFYQSLRTIRNELDEASRSLRCSSWQRFWRLEVPFAMSGLVWNTMMSMSGGRFFVVASEAISVGSVHIALPGVGSYVARAIAERDLAAVGWAILAMTIAIILYDQLPFRPIVAWADKFRFEQSAAQIVPRSWVLDLLRRSTLLKLIGGPAARRCKKRRAPALSSPSL